MKKFKKQIKLVICPTQYEDYDILAIGYKPYLIKLSKKKNYFHFMDSNSMKMSLVILDTCNTIKDTNKCLKEYKKLYIK